MQIFWINLARRSDRRAFMEAQFARLGLAATRLEAATPEMVSAADLAAYCDPGRPDFLAPREFACSLSHFRAMDALLDSSAPLAAVLEDDVVLSPRLPAFLAAIDAAPPECDLLRIETGQRRLRVKPAAPDRAGIGIVRFIGYEGGGAGYIVSRRGAERILASVEARQRPFDQALFDSSAPLARLLVLRQTNPGLCVQSKLDSAGIPTFASDLDTGTERREAAAPYRRRHRLHRLLRGLERDTVLALRKQWFERVEGARLVRIPFLAGD